MANKNASDAALLRGAVGALQRRLRAQDEASDLGPTGLLLLGRLSKIGSASATELAQLERLQPQSITRALRALEDGGFIDRAVDEDDRRRAVLSITEQGRAFLRRMTMKRIAWLARALDTHLNPEERDVLRAGAILIDRIATGDGGAVPPGDTVVNLIPNTRVTDVQRSLEFYQRFGFVVDGRHERGGRLAWVSMHARTVRAARIMLELAERPFEPNAQGIGFVCWTDDIVKLQRRLRHEGLSPGEINHPTHMPDGTFQMPDPDGYALTVIQVRRG
jgi:DNA-binding MarR family transcriptional regulator/catechol 2,3-dioxygenase-like lactoylglutathione lyase family enzyme